MTGVPSQIKALISATYKELCSDPAFRPRPAQREMIASVSNTLSPHTSYTVSAIESSTGTGKTLAYCIGAIPFALANDRPLIISTSTITLQNQLVSKDLPLLQEKTSLDFTFALQKGRRRYLCPNLLNKYIGLGDNTQQQIDGLDDQAFWTQPDETEINTMFEMSNQLGKKQWDGDLDAWQNGLSAGFISKITTSSSGCPASACSFYRQCPYFKQNAKVRKANVLVINHDLLLSDISMGGGQVLPDLSESYLVVDEAHLLYKKALTHFAKALDCQQVLDKLNMLSGMCSKIVNFLNDPKATVHHGKIVNNAVEVQDTIKRIQHLLAQKHTVAQCDQSTHEDTSTYRFTGGILTPELTGIFNTGKASVGLLCSAFSDLIELLKETLKQKTHRQTAGEVILTEAGMLCDTLGEVSTLFNLMCYEPASERSPPLAKWIEVTRQGRRLYHRISVSPIVSAGKLYKSIWNITPGAILSSATLSTMGGFAPFANNTGLSRLKSRAAFFQIKHAFDYAANARIIVPTMTASPAQQDKHTDEIIKLLPEIISDSTNTGCLVIFYSRKQMMTVAEKMPASIQDDLLVQDYLQKNILIERHVERIKSGRRSIVFGMSSFSEGVDLPGDLCSHVVICKLPFGVPSHPVDASLVEWFSKRGFNTFTELVLPETALRLCQAFGRLLRTETDQGRVTILDNRLITKRYGRQLLDTLPPARRELGTQCS